MQFSARNIVEWALFGPDSQVSQRQSVTESEDGQSNTDSKTPRPVVHERIRPAHSAFSLWKAIWHPKEHTWDPRVLQSRPIVGITAICVTVGCVFASLVVLRRSEGQTIEDWSLSPATWLAIITAISNSAIALAHLEAVPISWWYSATRKYNAIVVVLFHGNVGTHI